MPHMKKERRKCMVGRNITIWKDSAVSAKGFIPQMPSDANGSNWIFPSKFFINLLITYNEASNLHKSGVITRPKIKSKYADVRI